MSSVLHEARRHSGRLSSGADNAKEEWVARTSHQIAEMAEAIQTPRSVATPRTPRTPEQYKASKPSVEFDSAEKRTMKKLSNSCTEMMGYRGDSSKMLIHHNSRKSHHGAHKAHMLPNQQRSSPTPFGGVDKENVRTSPFRKPTAEPMRKTSPAVPSLRTKSPSLFKQTSPFKSQQQQFRQSPKPHNYPQSMSHSGRTSPFVMNRSNTVSIKKSNPANAHAAHGTASTSVTTPTKSSTTAFPAARRWTSPMVKANQSPCKSPVPFERQPSGRMSSTVDSILERTSLGPNPTLAKVSPAKGSVFAEQSSVPSTVVNGFTAQQKTPTEASFQQSRSSWKSAFDNSTCARSEVFSFHDTSAAEEARNEKPVERVSEGRPSAGAVVAVEEIVDPVTRASILSTEEEEAGLVALREKVNQGELNKMLCRELDTLLDEFGLDKPRLKAEKIQALEAFAAVKKESALQVTPSISKVSFGDADPIVKAFNEDKLHLFRCADLDEFMKAHNIAFAKLKADKIAAVKSFITQHQ